jgi:hypothetical protein
LSFPRLSSSPLSSSALSPLPPSKLSLGASIFSSLCRSPNRPPPPPKPDADAKEEGAEEPDDSTGAPNQADGSSFLPATGRPRSPSPPPPPSPSFSPPSLVRVRKELARFRPVEEPDLNLPPLAPPLAPPPDRELDTLAPLSLPPIVIIIGASSVSSPSPCLLAPSPPSSYNDDPSCVAPASPAPPVAPPSPALELALGLLWFLPPVPPSE